jgi:hypothetical protein
MATLGTQNISTSYVQLMKTSGLTGIDGTIQTITDGNNVSSALQLSTGGVSSTGSLSVTGVATVGSLEIGGSAGPTITKVSYGTAAFTLSTVQPHNLADTTTGTFALTGAELGDIVIGSINSLGSTTGTTQIVTSFFPISSNVIRYVVDSKGATAGTVPAGTIFATAMRFIA